ncbi:hypothetical protein ARMGADRAFT_610949 [Armillaria gallica]|uniref:Uncharacterized protein n=1 Tax=Armillaria gallica TaxID=47427 RepID=A0A2H3D040_ARMGA|nr:hypothetical protein ARMGADRAFT_610949 [Armillaria gallica]
MIWRTYNRIMAPVILNTRKRRMYATLSGYSNACRLGSMIFQPRTRPMFLHFGRKLLRLQDTDRDVSTARTHKINCVECSTTGRGAHINEIVPPSLISDTPQRLLLCTILLPRLDRRLLMTPIRPRNLRGYDESLWGNTHLSYILGSLYQSRNDTVDKRKLSQRQIWRPHRISRQRIYVHDSLSLETCHGDKQRVASWDLVSVDRRSSAGMVEFVSVFRACLRCI